MPPAVWEGSKSKKGISLKVQNFEIAVEEEEVATYRSYFEICHLKDVSSQVLQILCRVDLRTSLNSL